MAKILIGNIKGPQGEQGPRGVQGIQGITGATGQRGTRWAMGVAITGISTTPTVYSGTGISDSIVNDYYLNKDTGNMYRCTLGGNANTAKWVFVGNLTNTTVHTDTTLDIEGTPADAKATGDAIDNLNSIIGSLTSLNTSNKTSVVNAINNLNSIIGALTSLNTSNKTSIVNAINNLKSITDLCYISSITNGEFASLKEFVTATNTSSGVIKLLRFKDTVGWGPLGINTWYRAIVMYQNNYGPGISHGVGGDVIFFTNGNKIVYYGYIAGTYDDNNLTISYEKIKKDSDILDTAATIKANTSSGKGAGALGVKEIYNDFNSRLGGVKLGIDGDGNRGYYGADGSLIPFSSFSSMSIDILWGVGNATATNSTITLNIGGIQKSISNYKALVLMIGELGGIYDASVYGPYGATGVMVLPTESFIGGTQLKSSYQTYNATVSYVSNTQIKLTYALANNRQAMLLGIK